MRELIIASVFSAIGTTFGWFLTQTSTWFAGRNERKQKINTVTYILLETYYMLHRSNIEKYISKITETVASKINPDTEEEKNEIIKQLHPIYLGLFYDTFKEKIDSDIELLNGQFEESLKVLSTIDPINSYYLKGKLDLIAISDYIDLFYDNAKNKFADSAETIDVIGDEFLRNIKKNKVDESLEDLKIIIISISKKHGLIRRINIKRLLNKIDKNFNDGIDEEIKGLFEKLSVPKQNSANF